MVIELANGALRRAVLRPPVDTAPFLEAAKRCGVRKMGVERKEYDLLERPGFAQRLGGFRGQRVPVAHGNDGDGIDLARERVDQCAALPLGERSDRGTAANLGVLPTHGNGTPGRN